MENNSGFSDLEMGPLVGGKATHERKKKSHTTSSDGNDNMFGNITSSSTNTDTLKTLDFLSSNTADDSNSNNNNNRDSSSAAIGSQSQPTGGTSTAKYNPRKPNPAVAGKVVFACSLYAFCSVSMVLVNKSLASRYVINQ